MDGNALQGTDVLIDTFDPQSLAAPSEQAITDALWHLRRIEAKAERINTTAAFEIERVEQWRDERLAAASATPEQLDNVRQAIKDAVLAMRADNPRLKSLSTPWGTVRTTQSETIALTPEAEQWITENRPEWLRVKTEINKTAMKSAVVVSDEGITTEGEVIPGATVETRVSASITTTPAADAADGYH